MVTCGHQHTPVKTVTPRCSALRLKPTTTTCRPPHGHTRITVVESQAQKESHRLPCRKPQLDAKILRAQQTTNQTKAATSVISSFQVLFSFSSASGACLRFRSWRAASLAAEKRTATIKKTLELLRSSADRL